MPPSWCAALLAAAVIASCAAASTPCKQIYDSVSGNFAISSPPEGGECTALVLPRWHYPPAPSTAVLEAPQFDVVDILDKNERVVCAGSLVAADWVLTAGACAEAAVDVQWGPQRMGVRERVADPRGGAEAVALLRLEHAVCLKSVAVRMDDDASTIAAGGCRALLVEMVETSSALGSASPTSRWNQTMRCVPFDNRTTDVQTWMADMMDGNALSSLPSLPRPLLHPSPLSLSTGGFTDTVHLNELY
ncbi:hypothetical protein T484DRAFT_1796123 [Baffinella frigidus]|nr:hypothetical protein T484DRAFT_1796123 [Cryptophyta sp. CCMP2293]